MKKILLKLLLITSPILIILGVYLYNDPFKVLYHYDSYYKVWDSTTIYYINSDVVATETYIQNYPKYHYDSYIFGASRSGFYFVNDWNKHITSNHSYHFGVSQESLYGVERKLQFIAKRGNPIKNALIILDTGLLERTTNADDMISIKDPVISGESKMDFQMVYIKSFFDRHFLYAYFDHMLSGKLKRYMTKKQLMVRAFIHYNSEYNETEWTWLDYRIEKYEETFYRKRKYYFHQRDTVQHYSQPVIEDRQIALLNNMKAIFDKEHTNYKIVINPLYDQKKINPEDLKKLTAIFGTENIFDYSGINNITNEVHNYYENSHYRPHVCRQIMDSIYSQR